MSAYDWEAAARAAGIFTSRSRGLTTPGQLAAGSTGPGGITTAGSRTTGTSTNGITTPGALSAWASNMASRTTPTPPPPPFRASAGVTTAGAAANAQGRIIDPVGHFNFRVEIEGITAGAFREVDGLGVDVGVIELQDGTDLLPRKRPGRKKFNDLKLKQGYLHKNVLFGWILKVVQGKLERKSGSVVLLDDSMTEVGRYNFFDAWPKSWSGLRFDGNSQGVLMEELTLVMERMTVS